MASEESSEEDPRYWSDLLEHANSSKGGKGKHSTVQRLSQQSTFPKVAQHGWATMARRKGCIRKVVAAKAEYFPKH
eukprot:2216605-Lingulodinium_polyedra.AAC.1